MQSKATLGQSGPLTGLQLFTKVNCALPAIGGTAVTTPPAKPQLSPLPIDRLEIANTAEPKTFLASATPSLIWSRSDALANPSHHRL